MTSMRKLRTLLNSFTHKESVESPPSSSFDVSASTPAKRYGEETLVSQRRFFCHLANILLALYASSIYIWSEGEGTVLFSTLLCAASMAVMLYVVMMTRPFYIPGALFPLILFNIVCVLSILWSTEVDKATAMATRTLPLLTVFTLILYNYVDSTKDTRSLVRAIYAAGIVLALYTILKQGGIGGYFSQLSSGARVGSNVNNVNTIGLGAGTSAIIAFYYVFCRRRPQHLACLALCILVALGTGSNKALVILALGCMFVLLCNSISSGSMLSFVKLVFGVVAALLVLVFLLQLPMFETISTRFQGMVNSYMGSGRMDSSAITRNALVEAGIDQFFRTPLLGIGINNGGVVAMQAVGHDYYLHNNYIELLVGVGLIGAALFYALPVASVIVCLRKVRRGDSEAVLVAAILLTWLIIQWGYVAYYSKPTYLYLALFAAVAFPSGSSLKRGSSRFLRERGVDDGKV